MPATSSPLLSEALSAILMTESDLSFRTDYADNPDSFRTAVVDSLLTRPLDTESYVTSLADSLSAASGVKDIVDICWRQLERAGRTRDRVDDQATGARPGGGRGTAGDETGRDSAGDGNPVDALLSAARQCARDVDAAFARLSDEQRAFVAEHAAVLLEEDEFDPDKPIEVRDQEAELD